MISLSSSSFMLRGARATDANLTRSRRRSSFHGLERYQSDEQDQKHSPRYAATGWTSPKHEASVPGAGRWRRHGPCGDRHRTQGQTGAPRNSSPNGNMVRAYMPIREMERRSDDPSERHLYWWRRIMTMGAAHGSCAIAEAEQTGPACRHQCESCFAGRGLSVSYHIVDRYTPERTCVQQVYSNVCYYIL